MATGQADRAEQAVAAVLEAQGIRFTPARRLVVRALAQAPGPLAAAELHEAWRDRLPLSSLYRSLAVLAEAGVLAKEHGGTSIARYELAEWLVGHHHHVVCTTCGEVRDAAVDSATEAAIARLTEGIAAAAGYRARAHRMDIEGTCAACLSS